jgi:UDP-N-acetylmuramoylalanine--D-glutamate ligase
LYLNNQLLIKNEDLHIPGQHNKLNILAAATACQAIGLSLEAIREGIKAFKGLPHRTALVSEINGVAVYDDIQSTTPESTVAALDSFEKNCILIAGGDDKGMQYKNLANKIVEKVKKLILLPGTGTEIFKQLLTKQAYAFQECSSFSEALSATLKDARVGDTLLISPGCAHFQSNFLEGKSVKTWVEEY